MIYCSITPCMSSQDKSREALTIFSKLVLHFIFARALEAKMCECSPPGLMLCNPGIYLFWLSAKHANAGPESRMREESERGKKRVYVQGKWEGGNGKEESELSALIPSSEMDFRQIVDRLKVFWRRASRPAM